MEGQEAEKEPKQSVTSIGQGNAVQAAPDAVEDDDPYGLGTRSMKPTNFDQKALEAYQGKLTIEFQYEFKDSLSTIENLPRGHIILSAIKACLADENKLVKRGILDMVNTFLKYNLS